MNKGHDALTLTDGLDMLTALLLVVGRGKFSSLGGKFCGWTNVRGPNSKRECSQGMEDSAIVTIEGFRDGKKRRGPSFNQRQYD